MVLKKRSLTLKEDKWVDVTAKTLNASEGVRQAYNIREGTHKGLVTNMASTNLSKPSTRQALIKKLKEQGLNLSHASKIHKRNIDQDQNYAASNSALELYYKLQKIIDPKNEGDKHLHLHLNNEEEANQRLKEIREQV